MIRGISSMFSILGSGKIVYASTLENILNFEFVGENIAKASILSLGTIFETRRDRIDCCGGYKFYTGIELKYKDL